MSDDVGSPVDAFGGLVVLAFDLVGSEIDRAPDRLLQTFKSPTLLQAAENALLSFAKSRGPFGSSQLTAEEIDRLQSSVVGGVRTAATNAYLKQIQSSSKFKGLEAQLKNFEEAAKSSAIGVWIDRNKNILYVVGAALAVGAGVALYITKPSGPAYKMGLRELEKLKFEVVKVGALKLGVSSIVFDPTAERYGGKVTGKVEWEQLKLELALQIVTKSAEVTEIDGEVMVKYGVVSLTGIAKQDMTKPKVDLTLRLGANKDRFGLAIAAHLKDDNVTGSASASYKVAENLKLGVDLSRKNRPDMGNQTENLIMFELKGVFP
ncbi:MAG TPA: hypothetical protein VGN82_16420 [Bosea sp. (in: a-proteobacteria)]|uniref:hypothetical protein n=1 Tax=Bosea sp. (in: a-proteobacteria) TaxID=1871050 RepID=UPI002E1271BD|nr:hypothetical protein [Bosea sp. (in: a-proteobacteria)]